MIWTLGWIVAAGGGKIGEMADCASLSESGFSGLAGFQDFSFAQIALFAITQKLAKPNTDKMLTVKQTSRKNPENPIIP